MLDPQPAAGTDGRARLCAEATAATLNWHDWSEYEREVLTVYPKRLLQIKTKAPNKQSISVPVSF